MICLCEGWGRHTGGILILYLLSLLILITATYCTCIFFIIKFYIASWPNCLFSQVQRSHGQACVVFAWDEIFLENLTVVYHHTSFTATRHPAPSTCHMSPATRGKMLLTYKAKIGFKPIVVNAKPPSSFNLCPPEAPNFLSRKVL